jgi:catechol 2,3-dioxygenase-like lactoylglutathione lyase family enzyme
MAVTAMNHFTILTDDIAGTVRFYATHLGLVDGPRPAFAVPGAWLYCGDTPILHIVGGRPRDDLRAGVIDHMAFSAENLSDTLARLTAHGIQHTCRRQVGSGVWQVFFFDPNGARVELDFAADEPRHA